MTWSCVVAGGVATVVADSEGAAQSALLAAFGDSPRRDFHLYAVTSLLSRLLCSMLSLSLVCCVRQNDHMRLSAL